MTVLETGALPITLRGNKSRRFTRLLTFVNTLYYIFIHFSNFLVLMAAQGYLVLPKIPVAAPDHFYHKALGTDHSSK